MKDKKLRVGVIGCGMVAQIMHIPHLLSLPQLYEIAAFCDLSRQTTQALAAQYDVKHTYQDVAEMLKAMALDAVLILTPHHYPVAMTALEAGVHVFVEKPMSVNIEEATALVETARVQSVKAQVGYHKPYDPGYRLGAEMVRALPKIHMATMHIANGPNEPFLAHHEILRFQDIDPKVRDSIGQAMRQAMFSAIGDQPPHIARAYGSLLGGGCHQLSIMRGCLGRVQEVLSTEIWNEGRCIATHLLFENEVRCLFSSVFMPEIRLFNETFTAYASGESVAIRFPSPFLKNAATIVTRCHMEQGQFHETEMTANYSESFRNELIEFHHCIVADTQPRTPLTHGAEDAQVMIDIVRKSPDFVS